MRRYSPALVTLAAAALLAAACGGGGAEATIAPAAPRRLVIDFTFIDVVQDCDGIEGDGDFTFGISADLAGYPWERVFDLTQSLGPGDRALVGRSRSFDVPVSDGDSYVDVTFFASEWDKNIVGTTYADSRLNGASTTRQHVLTNGSWSKLGEQTITLGSGDCKVQLSYSAHGS